MIPVHINYYDSYKIFFFLILSFLLYLLGGIHYKDLSFPYYIFIY